METIKKVLEQRIKKWLTKRIKFHKSLLMLPLITTA